MRSPTRIARPFTGKRGFDRRRFAAVKWPCRIFPRALSWKLRTANLKHGGPARRGYGKQSRRSEGSQGNE